MNAANPAANREAKRYTLPAIVLHWVLGLSILGAFGMGLYVHELPFSPTKLKLINLHKWAGITILFLSVLRLLWCITRPPCRPRCNATCRAGKWPPSTAPTT
jgi:cytochrome b561